MKIPPTYRTASGTPFDSEEWVEYRLTDRDYSKPSITPQFLHPVQIRGMINRFSNSKCPIMLSLYHQADMSWTAINDHPEKRGRFLQAAYN